MTDWSGLLEAVAQELLGEPVRRSAGGEWRYRRKGSLAVHIDGPRRGNWRDHEAGVGGGVLDLLAHVEGLERDDALVWLRERGLLDGPPPAAGRPRRPRNVSGGRPQPIPPGKRPQRDTAAYGRRLWGLAGAVPADVDHAARRWLAHRHLWRPDLELPPSVRWLRDYKGPPVGALVAAFARPGAGRVAAVQLVHVDAEGLPVADRDGPDGLTKRTYGSPSGAVCVLGVVDAAQGVNVAEGLADALALAARLPWPAICLAGTEGFRNLDVARWLAGVGTAHIWADVNGPGLEAAHALGRTVAVFGGSASIERVSRGEDPGAAGVPLTNVDRDALREYTAELERDGLPAWEAARVASTCLGGTHD